MKVWDADTGPELRTLKGTHEPGHQRGVQPRRQTHRHAAAGPDGEGVGRRHGHGSALPQGAHNRRHQRGVQPRRQTHRQRQCWINANKLGEVKVWDAETGRGILALKGHTGDGPQRGVQPRRQSHRRGLRQDGEGVGRGHGPEVLSLKGHTGQRHRWRSAPTANASSASTPVRSRRGTRTRAEPCSTRSRGTAA